MFSPKTTWFVLVLSSLLLLVSCNLLEKKDAAIDEGSKAVSETVEVAKGKADMSEEEFKKELDKMSKEDLQAMADELKAAIEAKEAAATETGTTKKAPSGWLANLDMSSLKEKLSFVVEKLKALGVDVSAYTGFLTGTE